MPRARSPVAKLQGKVNTILEILKQFGVTAAGIEKLRSRSLPLAFGRQIAACINERSFSTEKVLLSQFITFVERIAFTDFESLRSKPSYSFEIDDFLGVNNSRDLGKLLPTLPSWVKRFIVIPAGYLTSIPDTTPGLSVGQAYLNSWSQEYLLGGKITPCRPDSVPYLAQSCRKLLKHERDQIIIATEPNDKVPGCLGFQKRGAKVYLKFFPEREVFNPLKDMVFELSLYQRP